MKPSCLAPLLALLLTACGLSQQQKSDYASVQHSEVSPAIYDKMIHGDDLGLSDIKSLTRAGVSDDVILRYLRDRGTVYHPSPADVRDLRRAGVSQRVIHFLLQSGTAAQANSYNYGPYTQDPFYPALGPGGGGGPGR